MKLKTDFIFLETLNPHLRNRPFIGLRRGQRADKEDFRQVARLVPPPPPLPGHCPRLSRKAAPGANALNGALILAHEWRDTDRHFTARFETGRNCLPARHGSPARSGARWRRRKYSGICC